MRQAVRDEPFSFASVNTGQGRQVGAGPTGWAAGGFFLLDVARHYLASGASSYGNFPASGVWVGGTERGSCLATPAPTHFPFLRFHELSNTLSGKPFLAKRMIKCIVGFCSYELRTPIRADIVSFPPYENRNLREIK